MVGGVVKLNPSSDHKIYVYLIPSTLHILYNIQSYIIIRIPQIFFLIKIIYSLVSQVTSSLSVL